MTEEKVLLYALGLLVTVVAFFLKGVISRMETVEAKSNLHETKIQVIEANHNSLDKRFDELNTNVKALTDKINTLLMKLSNTHE